jgi:nicotinate-nucleotide pyrophosphorylase (carboxylating)
MISTREQRIEQALFRGAGLTLENPAYRRSVGTLLEALLQDDLAGGDLTAQSLGLGNHPVPAAILAREAGVAAGLGEASFFLDQHGMAVEFDKKDGDVLRPGDVLLHLDADRTKLLALERVGLNLLQRMSGIASMSRCLQQRIENSGYLARIVGTRKTPWGLLDKRALHLGNGGTHRISLGDAILIKNNHLALLASREEDAAPVAIERAWKARGGAAFIEVEVRSEEAACAAAHTFRRLRCDAAQEYPCLLMLDNMTPAQTNAVLDRLRRRNLWDDVLIEASGGISERNMLAYAAAGVDAISIGALTHSVRVLDLAQKIS